MAISGFILTEEWSHKLGKIGVESGVGALPMEVLALLAILQMK